MERERKSASELEEMIWQRAGERADCPEVRSVAVTRGDSGWRVVTILRDGNLITPKAIEEIAAQLRAKYDLAV